MQCGMKLETRPAPGPEGSHGLPGRAQALSHDSAEPPRSLDQESHGQVSFFFLKTWEPARLPALESHNLECGSDSSPVKTSRISPGVRFTRTWDTSSQCVPKLFIEMQYLCPIQVADLPSRCPLVLTQ